MLAGLIQDDHPLTLQYVLRRMRTVHRDSELVYPPDGRRARYEEVGERVDRLAAALRRLGVGESDRVGTLMWNRPEYFEAYFAVPAMGAVLHPLNQRLFASQLAYIVNHAHDRVVIVEDVLVPLMEELADQLPAVEHFIVVGDGDAGSLAPVRRYEDLLAAEEPGFAYPAIPDDRQASALAYTSGTTGNPKGVLYSHRGTVLHAITLCTVDTFGIRASDRILQTSPLFHAIGWCLPYAAGMAGASVVLPGRNIGAGSVCELIEQERITFTGAVPTVLADVLRHADEHRPDLSSLRFVLSGASAAPMALLHALQERHGVEVTQSWGMTEHGPVGGVAWAPPGAEGERAWEYRRKSARIFPLTDCRIVDADGNDLPWDGVSSGELLLRGPFTASGYMDDVDSDSRFTDGWLRSGDIATIDPRGYLQITDRLKDVIKSGGEWISSVDLENETMSHEDVHEAVVIAMPDERWGERPLVCVVRSPGATVGAAELRRHLSDRVARFWLPDAFAFLEEVPKTGTGKFDKKTLRAELAAGRLGVETLEPEVRT